MFEIPFRWDITRRNQLGSLVEGEAAATYCDFREHLLSCCSRVLAFAGDSDLIFVGRSPESVFDHLSGLLFDTSWFDRLELLHFSMRFRDEVEIRREHPAAIEAMRAYLGRLGLHPEGVATRERPAAFIDLVASGDTFGRLVTFLYNWSRDVDYDWNAVRRRIRLVGITEQTKTSPKTWRWQQHAAWLPLVGRGAVKNVSVPYALWNYLGNYQDKVSFSYTPSRWGDEAFSSPTHHEGQLRALRLALGLFELGRQRSQREQLASRLVREPAMRHGWFRMLVQELRSQPSRIEA
ncbi:MAG TPA: hypothetical protein VK388_07250 [Pyrinomonadaceae bacterium]|nr:hypothetical protein [Pyrinomonadaceae bacterium]